MAEGADENKNKAIGCLAIVALAVIITGVQSVWGWISGSSREEVPYEITIEINQGMVDQFVLSGTGCDLSGDYEVVIYGRDDGQDVVDRQSLGAGRAVDNVFCQYTIRGKVPRHKSYTVKVETHVWSGDPDILGKRIELSGTSDEIRETLRWYNPRDND